MDSVVKFKLHPLFSRRLAFSLGIPNTLFSIPSMPTALRPPPFISIFFLNFFCFCSLGNMGEIRAWFSYARRVRQHGFRQEYGAISCHHPCTAIRCRLQLRYAMIDFVSRLNNTTREVQCAIPLFIITRTIGHCLAQRCQSISTLLRFQDSKVTGTKAIGIAASRDRQAIISALEH